MTLRYRPALRVCHGMASWQRFGFSRNAFNCYSTRTYDDAINYLNSLQTPHKVITENRAAGIKQNAQGIQDMIKYLSLIGHSVSDLDKLNVVHVAGTKGKGSTCAYVDSILAVYRKKYGFPKKVGLYTSPHLVSVCERIKINSAPISKELFAKYFFEVWDILEAEYDAAIKNGTLTNLPIEKKPGYFKYLTLMCFHIFLKEGVDVAIIETGVGGRFDSTNIVEHPAVTGISSLDIDHTYLLGDTIEKIAWQKAGILKPATPAFSSSQRHSRVALQALRDAGAELGIEVRNAHRYCRRMKDVKLPQPQLNPIVENAGLAVSLAHTVLRKLIAATLDITHPPLIGDDAKTLNADFIEGLEGLVTVGRFDVRREKAVTWYLDGAHNEMSMELVMNWFGSEYTKRWKQPQSRGKAPATRVLIFNQQGDHDATKLLEVVFKTSDRPFSHVIFCPSASQAQSTSQNAFVNHAQDSEAILNLSFQFSLAQTWQSLEAERDTVNKVQPHAKVAVLPSVADALDYARKLTVFPVGVVGTREWVNDHIKSRFNKAWTWCNPRETPITKAQSSSWLEDWQRNGRPLEAHVLITGSIHLVGRAIESLEQSGQAQEK
ncbi:Mur ligase [Calycina marina]|uniref:Folylpolyglutamate synthase n=1 Tax=Calycina marina TaxID=1763456 RepID=A0A9P7Z1C7_9HELO|nr:Mur ligase [Calycina marina]